MKFNEIIVGLTYECKHIITSDTVLEFAKISGDNNPIHINDEYASNSIFKQKIVHGMFVGSFFSRAIASELPGPGSIYLNQTMNFLKPIYHNSEVKICLKVESLKPEKKIVFLSTNCWVLDTLVIEGSAIVKCLE